MFFYFECKDNTFAENLKIFYHKNAENLKIFPKISLVCRKSQNILM